MATVTHEAGTLDVDVTIQLTLTSPLDSKYKNNSTLKVTHWVLEMGGLLGDSEHKVMLKSLVLMLVATLTVHASCDAMHSAHLIMQQLNYRPPESQHYFSVYGQYKLYAAS